MAKRDRLTPKQFEKSLAEYREGFVRNLEARCSGFDPDEKASQKRRTTGREDFEFFARTYFPHYIRGKKDPKTGIEKPINLSNLHRYFCDHFPALIENPESVNEVIAAPRGEAKSTYALIFTIYCAVYELKHYMIYIMDVFDQASVVVEAFKVEFDSNPRLRTDFPDIMGKGPVWQDGVCVTRNNIKLHARGAGQRIRGLKHGARRPDLAVLDDIENDENVKTPKQRDKLESWIDTGVANLGEAGEKFDLIFVGTVLHYDSVLVRKLNNPLWQSIRFQSILKWPDRMDMWDAWEEILRNQSRQAARDFYAKNRAKMEKGAVVSWPEKRPLLYLMELRARIGHKSFSSEQQNEAIDENAAFQNFTYWVQFEPQWVYFGACDPSLGKKGNHRDPSAILVGGFDRRAGELAVIEASIRKRVPKVIISDIIAFQKQYGCVAWGIETVQFQEFLRTQLIDEAIRQHIALNGVPVPQNTDKDLRIESLQVPISDGRIKLHPSQNVLRTQLEQWPNGDHDDGPDALEMLWTLAITYGAPLDIRTGGQRASMNAYGEHHSTISVNGNYGAASGALNWRGY
ncbi:phage terminase large subunit [Thalassospira sp. MCCC 1A01428]|uniref:phage terminase large subunit n=1 Tax=Thalassospira sp. MCCC 1A01428 TaxID=1470575 RepID=UPI000A1EB775|nr:phage terminase large subunit [Thalassospira sp. MCCC 1A01428]